jgi:hypothetical protein
LKTKFFYNKNSNTNTFLYKKENAKLREPENKQRLKLQAEIFFNILLRLVTPKAEPEMFNFILDYRTGKRELEKSSLTTSLKPFHEIKPELIAEAFAQGNANNLGSILCLNMLTNTPFSIDTLLLAQSKKTKAFYFTQSVSPAWLYLFDNKISPISLETNSIHASLETLLHTFLESAHTDWWKKTGLLVEYDANFFVNYANILLDEAQMTMFKLYLTPPVMIDYLLQYACTLSGEAFIEESFRQAIHHRLEQFKSMFLKVVVPTLPLDKETFSIKFLNYLADIENFSVFPFAPFKYQLDEIDLFFIKTKILYFALDTPYLSDIFLQEVFNGILIFSGNYLDVMLEKKSCDIENEQTNHIIEDKIYSFWFVLNKLSGHILVREQIYDSIPFSERLYCLLVKSMVEKYHNFSYLILKMLSSTGDLLQASQYPLPQWLAEFYHPHWKGYGLLDIADTLDNQEIKDYLSSAGATKLITSNSSARLECHSPLLFFAEQENTELSRRPRSYAYEDLTELLHQPAHDPTSKIGKR